jgi:hypothetical protein
LSGEDVPIPKDLQASHTLSQFKDSRQLGFWASILSRVDARAVFLRPALGERLDSALGCLLVAYKNYLTLCRTMLWLICRVG